MTSQTDRPGSTRTRPAKPPLSRDAIVRTALNLIDEFGVEAVSMRKVATQLDTAAASLYVYVTDRKDLLDAVYDLALADVPIGHGRVADWRAELEDLLTDQIRVLATHDDIALVALVKAQVGPNSLAITERVLALLRRSGLAEESLLAAADLLDQYVASTAIERAGWARRARSKADQTTAAAVADPSIHAARSRIEQAYEALPESEFPEITALRARLGESDPDERHRWKLGAVINGIIS